MFRVVRASSRLFAESEWLETARRTRLIRCRYLPQCLEFAFDGVRKDFVTGGVGMDEIGHEFGLDGAATIEELVADIPEEQAVVVGEPGETAIYLDDLVPRFGVGGLAARQQSEQKHVC